jgi:hypothetical protein
LYFDIGYTYFKSVVDIDITSLCIDRIAKNMATWSDEKFQLGGEDGRNDTSLDNILQDCMEDSFDIPTFGRVFEQLPVYTTSRLCDENPESSSYIGKLAGHDENAG